MNPDTATRKPRLWFIWNKNVDDLPNTPENQRLQLLEGRFRVVAMAGAGAQIAGPVREHCQVVQPRWGIPGLGGLSYVLFTLTHLQKVGRKLDITYTERGWTSVIGFLGSRFLKMPWVVELWDDPRLEYFYHRQNSRWVRATWYGARYLVLRWLLHAADLVITTIHPGLLDEMGIRPKAVFHNTQSCDFEALEKLRTPRNKLSERLASKLRLAYVGWIEPARGVETVFSSMKELRCQVPEIELTLIGIVAQRYRKWLKGWLDELGSSVCYRGVLPWRQAMAEVAQCDVGIYPFPNSPELRYVIPVKVMEYLALGLPVVATDLPGVRAMVQDGWNGVLITPSSSEALSEAILRLYHDPNLRMEMAERAPRSVAQMDRRFVNRALADRLAAIVSDNWKACAM